MSQCYVATQRQRALRENPDKTPFDGDVLLEGLPVPVVVLVNGRAFQNAACRALFGYGDHELADAPPVAALTDVAPAEDGNASPIFDLPVAAKDGRLLRIDLYRGRSGDAVIGILIDAMARSRPTGTGESPSVRRLTARETEIASMIASGMTNKAIAKHLNLTEGTVKVHVHHMFKVLGLKSRREVGEALRRLGVSARRAQSTDA
jgi:DNA-binding CsgD family transcriptional regulator